MRSLIISAFLATGSIAAAASAQSLPVVFDWPEATPGAIPDLRLNSTVRDAEDAARQATTRAAAARRIAAHANRRKAVQGLFGIKPYSANSDDETEVSITRGQSHGTVLGATTYPNGAEFTGAIGPNEGVYVASSDSPLLRFSGFVWGATTDNPTPREGIYEWKDGDRFVGSVDGDGSASSGVYYDRGGQRKFVGEIDLSQTEFRPLHGYVEDGSGRLLAVVR